MKVTKFEEVTGLFSGIGDLFVFNEVADYTGKTLSDFANPQSLGQIVQDSTSWDGEDPEVEELKDEQGISSPQRLLRVLLRSRLTLHQLQQRCSSSS